MNVTLVAFKPDGTRVDFRVKGARCVVGRDTGADLRIPVGIVSRQHCEFRLDDDEVVLRDLGSSNGTFLNGKRVTEATLDAGDIVRVGPTTFTVVIDGIPDVVTPHDHEEHEAGPDGSSMMDQPVRAGAPAPAAAAIGAGPTKSKPTPPKPPPADDDDDDAPARSEGGFEDPLSKMIERQDDEEDDFDFDFFDDEDDDDDDLR